MKHTKRLLKERIIEVKNEIKGLNNNITDLNHVSDESYLAGFLHNYQTLKLSAQTELTELEAELKQLTPQENCNE